MLLKRAFRFFQSGQLEGARLLVSSLSKIPQQERSSEHRIASEILAFDDVDHAGELQLDLEVRSLQLSDGAKKWIEELPHAANRSGTKASSL